MKSTVYFVFAFTSCICIW